MYAQQSYYPQQQYSQPQYSQDYDYDYDDRPSGSGAIIAIVVAIIIVIIIVIVAVVMKSSGTGLFSPPIEEICSMVVGPANTEDPGAAWPYHTSVPECLSTIDDVEQARARMMTEDAALAQDYAQNPNDSTLKRRRESRDSYRRAIEKTFADIIHSGGGGGGGGGTPQTFSPLPSTGSKCSYIIGSPDSNNPGAAWPYHTSVAGCITTLAEGDQARARFAAELAPLSQAFAQNPADAELKRRLDSRDAFRLAIEDARTSILNAEIEARYAPIPSGTNKCSYMTGTANISNPGAVWPYYASVAGCLTTIAQVNSARARLDIEKDAFASAYNRYPNISELQRRNNSLNDYYRAIEDARTSIINAEIEARYAPIPSGANPCPYITGPPDTADPGRMFPYASSLSTCVTTRASGDAANHKRIIETSAIHMLAMQNPGNAELQRRFNAEPNYRATLDDIRMTL